MCHTHRKEFDNTAIVWQAYVQTLVLVMVTLSMTVHLLANIRQGHKFQTGVPISAKINVMLNLELH